MRIILFLFLFIPQLALAAACVSTGTGGDWATASTWTSCGGGVPGDGDTAAIADGDIVTIAASSTITVGANGAANAFAIDLQGDDSDLIISDNVTLNVKGSIDINGEFTVGAGVDIIFNATNNQRIYIGENYDPSIAENLFDINGTSGNRSTLQNIGAGVVNIQCRNAEDSPCRIAMDYVDVTDFGSASIDAISATSRNLTNFGWMNLTNVTFDGCGMVNNITTLKNGFDYNLVNVTIRNTLNASYGIRIFNSTTPTTGERTISGSVFEDVIRFEEPIGFTITDTFFLGGISSVTTSGGTYTLSNVVIYDSTASELSLAYASADDVLYIGDNAAKTNAHIFTGLTGDYDQSFTNGVITCNWTDDTGDTFLMGVQPTQARTLTLTGNLMLPGANANGCGTLISQLGDEFSRWVVEHNTLVVDGQAAIAVGETYSGTSGMSTNVTNNLVVNITGGSASGYIVEDVGTDDSVTDLIASSAIDYNGTFNLAAATNQLEFSSGSPQANGVTGDPGFADTGCRTVADYRDDTKATTGSTIANVIAELAKKNDSDWDTDYDLDSILTYFRDCWKPSNTDFQAANDSDFGGWMGAVEGAAAGGSFKDLMMTGVG